MTRFLAALAVFFATLLPAGPGHAGQVRLLGQFPGKPAPAAERPVFPEDVPEIKAEVMLPAGQKTKIEFMWFDPSGRLYLRTLKIAFPARDSKETPCTDTLKVAGSAVTERPGWWSVEAVISDKKLSTRFLLTKSRQILTLAYGETGDKLVVLKGLDTNNSELRDMISVAVDDPDEEVRAAALTALGGLKDEWAVKYLRAGQADAYSKVRAAALCSLLKAGGDAGLEAFSAAASDPSPDVRRAAAERLLPEADERGAQAYKKLITDPDKSVRAAALYSLSRQSGAASLQALAEGLKVDDYGFRMDIIGMLSSRSGPGRIPALAAGLSVPDPAIRIKAIKALAKEKDDAAVALIRPLTDDKDLDAARQALEVLKGRKDIPGLEQAVRSRHRTVRKEAVEALVGLRDGAGARGLAEAIKDEDSKIKKEALAGLVAAGTAGVPGLIAALSDTDGGIRTGAASALEALGAKEAEGPMRSALGDRESSVRKAAFDYFIKVGGPALPGILKSFACDDDPDIRATGLGRLAAMPGEESSRALKAYMDCGDAGMRQAVVEILANRDDAAAVEVVKASLKDKDPAIRLKAAERLIALGVNVPVTDLASDPDPGVRRLAFQSMEKAPAPEMLPVLEAGIKDNDEGVRLAALGALGRLPGGQSSAAISRALKDGSRRVRGLARTLILSRQDEAAADGIYEIFLQAPPGGRDSALSALGAIPGERVDEMLYGIFSEAGTGEKARVLDMLAARKSGLLPEAIKEALKDGDARLHMTALGLARDIPESAALDVCKSALSSEYAEVREAGIERIRGIGGEAAVAALRGELDDPVPALRKRALTYLISLGDPSIPGRLARLVLDSDPGVRLAALEAAIELKDTPNKADALIAAAGGPYPELARTALDNLLPLDDARALPFYSKFFRSGYRRHELMRAMTRIKGGDALEAISGAYREAAGDERLRLIAIESLAARGVRALPALSDALSDPSAEVRMTALKAVEGIGAPGREDIIGRALTDSDQRVKKEALTALSGIGGREAFKQMLPVLNDPELQDDALTALARRPGPEQQAELAGYAAGLKDDAFRAGVLKTLEEGGFPTALLAKFAECAGLKTRERAAKALSARSGPEAVYGLLLIGADKDARLQELAVKALVNRKPEDMRGGIDLLFERGHAGGLELSFAAGTLDDPELIAYVIKRVPAGDKELLKSALGPVTARHAPYDVPAIMEGLSLADADGRRALARALAAAESPDIGKRLKQAYSAYPDIRGELIRSAGEGGGAGYIMELALKDKDAALRREAARYLKSVKGGGFLRLAIKDADEAVRSEAAGAAVESGDEAVLALAARDAAGGIRKTAARGLGGVGGDSALRLLTALARDGETEVSDEALASLQRHGEKVPTAVWEGLAADTACRSALRLFAMNVLAGRNEPGSAPVFAKALDDPSPELKKVAMDGMKGLGKKSLPVLYGLLGDPGRALVSVQLILDIGDASSEGPVLAALPRMDGAVRVKAVDALGKFGGQKSLPVLASSYKDGPPELKNAVVKAIGLMKLAGDDPAVLGILSDALRNGSDSIRFNAVHSAAALKAKSLKEEMEKGLGVEQSALIREELTKAVNAVSEKKSR